MKLPLRLNNQAPHHEDVWEGEWRYSSTFLNLDTRWKLSCHGHSTPAERGHGTHYVGGWARPRAGLNAIE